MSKTKLYAVAVGRKPGIYPKWAGHDGAESQVKGFPGAKHKSFATRAEAERWLETSGKDKAPASMLCEEIVNLDLPRAGERPIAPCARGVTVFADGACVGNPGPGGYGIVILERDKREEACGGFRLTTNNRMELMACILALQQLDEGCDVVVHTDSRYVVNGVQKGWAANWRSRGWRRGDGHRAENPDLWERLLDLCDKHRVQFIWVKGHAGNRENERCDFLSMQAASGRNLPDDPGYLCERRPLV